MRARLVIIAIVAVVAAFAAVLALCLVPLRPSDLDSRPSPATSYADAVARLQALGAVDGPDVNAVCRTRAYLHGAPTDRVIVFLHGLTNCPAQFDSLARLAYASGANVIVPRLPAHGYADRMSPALGRLDPRALCATTDRVVDAAHGLGRHVVIVGLSLGGTLAAWAAEERDDVEKVVLIAPMFGLPGAPGASIFGLTRALATLPNAFMWWDPRVRERIGGPPQVYPRFATRAIAATLLVAARVRADATEHPPCIHSVVLITLARDPAVDNAAAQSLLTDWRLHGVRDVRTHEFPGGHGLSHDVVDPRQIGADPAFVYPTLLEALNP